MWVSERSAQRSVAPFASRARRDRAPRPAEKAPAASSDCFRKARRSITNGIGYVGGAGRGRPSRTWASSPTLLVSSRLDALTARPLVKQLLHIVEFLLQTARPPNKADYIQQHNQPRGKEAVKQEGEVSLIHYLTLSHAAATTACAFATPRGPLAVKNRSPARSSPGGCESQPAPPQ